MFRFIGVVAVVAVCAGCFLYLGGYLDGDASVTVTNKGRQALNTGVTVVQDGVNGGLDSLKTQANEKLAE